MTAARGPERTEWRLAPIAVWWIVEAAVFASDHRYRLAVPYALLSVVGTIQFFAVRRRRHAIVAAEQAWASGEATGELPAKILARYTRLSPIHDRLPGRPLWQRWIGAGTNGVVAVDGASLTWSPRGLWTRVLLPLAIDRDRVSDCRRNGNDVVLRVEGGGQLVLRSPAAILVEAWVIGATDVEQPVASGRHQPARQA